MKFMLRENSDQKTSSSVFLIETIDEMISIIQRDYNSYSSNAERTITISDILIESNADPSEFNKDYPFVVSLKGSELISVPWLRNYPVGYLTSKFQ